MGYGGSFKQLIRNQNSVAEAVKRLETMAKL